MARNHFDCAAHFQHGGIMSLGSGFLEACNYGAIYIKFLVARTLAGRG